MKAWKKPEVEELSLDETMGGEEAMFTERQATGYGSLEAWYEADPTDYDGKVDCWNNITRHS